MPRALKIVYGVLATVFALMALVGVVVAQYSVVLAAVAVAATAVAAVRYLHRPRGYKVTVREKDDAMMFKFCQSGALKPFRSTYRLLPSDPRCRICLIPFKGVGKVLGVKPSRKNSNFCPS